ncbi:MAG: hypothetical protein K6T72_08390, partial [Anoxybacillus sp.]
MDLAIKNLLKEIQEKTHRPRATYRLQLGPSFTFRQAADLVAYLDELGISDCYISPIFLPCSLESHGYDVCDHNQLNPALGSTEDFENFVRILQNKKMGLILDMVPNHMGIGGEKNVWWMDVLENGPSSPYANYFDIDWQSPNPDLRGKVLLPILGDPYWQTLESGALTVQRGGDGRLALRYGDHDLPLAEPDDTATPAGANAQHDLLERQSYRLAWWRTGAAMLNWRRFFEITELVGVRQECEDVFEATHALPFRLYREGWIDGLRIDHVDG